MPAHGVGLQIASSDKDPEEHARNVGVEYRGALTEREASHGTSGVLANALEREQRRLIRWQLPAIALDRLSSDAVKSPRPDVVAERSPGCRHVGFGGGGQHFERRIFFQPLGVLRQHALDLRLLQHDLGHEDVVGIRSLSPRKVASVASIPCQQSSSEALPGCRRGYCGQPSSSGAHIMNVVKIYTRTGDAGETGLLGGSRVSKASPRVAAYGDVDELNAWLGLVRSFATDEQLKTMLERIQRDLFAIGARLADPVGRVTDRVEKTAVTTDAIKQLEDWIDQLDGELPSLRRFILAGGSPPGASLHVARTVCRRAERSVVALGVEQTEPELRVYLNRLSDLLFVMARAANHRQGVAESEW